MFRIRRNLKLLIHNFQKIVYNSLKNKIDKFEDLEEMPKFNSMNLIYYSKGYAIFISKLPSPIKMINVNEISTD